MQNNCKVDSNSMALTRFYGEEEDKREQRQR